MPPSSLPHLPDVLLLEKIRETPQSIWFRARQERLRRDVLLKVRPVAGGTIIPGEKAGEPFRARAAAAGKTAADDGKALRRAREEMLLLSRLHCDGISAAIDLQAAGDWLYQLVELPSGEPLTRLLPARRGAPWPLPEALAIARRVAEALDHAHRAGVILRRIHPEDVFLAPDGRVKIASLEWAVQPGVDPGLPGDLHWVAPEVAGSGQATAAADAHALGLLLAWLLTLKEPPASGLRRADEKALEALRARGAKGEVLELVARILEPDPARRPANGAALVDELRALDEQLLAPRGGTGRKGPAALVLSLLLVAFAIGGVFLAYRWARPRPSGSRSQTPAVVDSEPDGDQDGSPPVETATSETEDSLEGSDSTSDRPEKPKPSPLVKGKDAIEEKTPIAAEGKEEKSAIEPEKPSGEPDPELAAARKELAAIEEAWRAEPTSWAKAESALIALGNATGKSVEKSSRKDPWTGSAPRRPARTALGPEALTLLEEIRADWSAKGSAALEAFSRGDLARLLRDGDLQGAARGLSELAGRFPRERERLGALGSEISRAEEAAVAKLEADLEARLAAGDFPGAEQLLDEGSGRLSTERKSAERARLGERIAGRKRSRSAETARVAAAVSAAWGELRQLRIAEARRAIEGAKAPEELAAPLREIAREIELASGAIAGLEKGLDRAIEGKIAVRARLLGPTGEPGEPVEIFIDGRTGLRLAAHRRGVTVPLKLHALDLDLPAIVALAERSAAPPPEPSVLQEGFLILFLATQRSGAAERVFADPSLKAIARPEYLARLEEARSLDVQERLERASRRSEELLAAGGSAADWTALRDSAAGLIAAARRRPLSPEDRAKLEKVFLAAEKETLRNSSPESLFHGKLTRDRTNGSVRILYDFADDAQLQDWRLLTDPTRAVRSGKALRLRGAIRLRTGDPFRGKIRASVMVPEKGYPPAPGLGLILHSRDRDRKGPAKKAPPPPPTDPPQGTGAGSNPKSKPASGGPPPAPGPKPSPAPAAPAPVEPDPEPGVAVVIGYRTNFGSIEVPSGPGEKSAETSEVPTPAQVLFLAKGIEPEEKEAIRAVPGGHPQGSLLLQAELGNGQFSCLLNGRAVFPNLGDAISRRFPREAPPPTGSVTVFTDGPPVTIEAIEVTGVLRGEWVEERLERMAKEELSRLNGEGEK